MTQVAKMKLYRMQKDGGSRLRSCHIFMFSLSLSLSLSLDKGSYFGPHPCTINFFS